MHRISDGIQWEKHIKYSTRGLAHKRSSVNSAMMCRSYDLVSGGCYRDRPEKEPCTGNRGGGGGGASGLQGMVREEVFWLAMSRGGLWKASRGHATPTFPLLPGYFVSMSPAQPWIYTLLSGFSLCGFVHCHTFFILRPTLFSFCLPASPLAS